MSDTPKIPREYGKWHVERQEKWLRRYRPDLYKAYLSFRARMKVDRTQDPPEVLFEEIQ